MATTIQIMNFKKITFIEFSGIWVNNLKTMDGHLHVVGIFFDLTKAYDVLDNNTLLHNLNSYGIRGNMNLWFKSYVSNHLQFVEITQIEGINFTQYRYTSSLRKAVSVVPQGSI